MAKEVYRSRWSFDLEVEKLGWRRNNGPNADMAQREYDSPVPHHKFVGRNQEDFFLAVPMTILR